MHLLKHLQIQLLPCSVLHTYRDCFVLVCLHTLCNYLEQHHCRKCGQALCDKCTPERSTLPALGFEFEVRICKDCADNLTDAE